MRQSLLLLTSFIIIQVISNADATEWGGFAALEGRYFPQLPSLSKGVSLVLQPEFRHEWPEDNQSWIFVPFLHLDQRDPERSHFDIRELMWLKAEENWELRVGIGKLFWGVTESQHLVDIINQTDWVEDPKGEDKLGQPMVNLTWGTLDIFILPGFRERTFPGPKGRAGGLPIAREQTRYESGAKEKHVDWALRWSRNLAEWDLGLAHFVGTSREPRWLLGKQSTGQAVLIPYYEQISQTSLDLQLTQEAWLWKLEMISRSDQTDRFTALTSGFEYTFSEVGLIGEYLFDDRHNKATTLFDNDIMLGLRVVLNDVQSTELLVSSFLDIDNRSRFYNVEASRRLGKNWKFSLESRIYAGAPGADIAASFRHDDYWQLGIAWYF